MKNLLKSAWENIELFIMVICLDAFMINILLQIVTRIFFNNPLNFTEEVSRYLFVWMVFLALPYSTYHNTHISMDLFVKHLPQLLQYILKILIHLLTIAVFCWIVYYGIDYLNFSKNVNVPALGISKSVIASIIPISGVLMVIRSIERMIMDIKEYRNTKKST